MRDIWVISDTHFNHANMLHFTNSGGDLIRPGFDSVCEVNELITDNWNRVVKHGDIVYHLGDVFFGDKDEAKKIMSRLNGRKRLVVGNHDDIKYIAQAGMFQKIQMWRMFPEFGLLLTHVPAHESALKAKSLINVHGHIHANTSPAGSYFNACVESTNYTPVNIEEIKL